jgi:hypothetical protein
MSIIEKYYSGINVKCKVKNREKISRIKKALLSPKA